MERQPVVGRIEQLTSGDRIGGQVQQFVSARRPAFVDVMAEAIRCHKECFAELNNSRGDENRHAAAKHKMAQSYMVLGVLLDRYDEGER